MSNKSVRFPETSAEYNHRLDRRLQRIPGMNLKRWKLFRSILLPVTFIGFAAFAILEGADPTTIALPALLMAALLGGVEVSELIAVLAEAQTEYQSRTDNDDDAP